MKIFLQVALIFLILSCEKLEEPATFELTTETIPEEAGSVSPSEGKFGLDEKIELEATPAEGYYFMGWTGDISSTENPMEMVIKSDRKITAIFEKIDEDKDGVADDIDQCLETPEGEQVDEQGCSESQKDTDGDGIQDSIDNCPETNEGETVDENGCSNGQKDTDGDGINDALDVCPETPEGEDVNEQGCSDTQKDSDNDGVMDDLDQCPETPEGEDVDEQGCANTQKDSDGDGVTNDLDQCPETPERENVDEQGCADTQKDSDGDGVTDDLDQCPETIDGGIVDEDGCVIRLKTYVPDDSFEQQLINEGYDDVLDDYVLTSKISEVERLFLSGIKDFTGLDAFVSLEYLFIGDSWDPSYAFNAGDFPNLSELTLSFVQLKSLKIDETSNLQYLYPSMGLETLIVTNNRSLTSLGLDESFIKSATVSGNVNLRHFNIGSADGGSIDDLTLTDNPSLFSLSFELTPIQRFYMSNNPAIEKLHASFMWDVPFELSDFPNLKYIGLESSAIEVDVSSHSALETLYLFESGATQLDVSNNRALKTLNLFETPIEKLDLSNNMLLDNMNLEYNTALTCIQVNQQQLDDIPVNWKIIGSTTEYSLDCPD